MVSFKSTDLSPKERSSISSPTAYLFSALKLSCRTIIQWNLLSLFINTEFSILFKFKYECKLEDSMMFIHFLLSNLLCALYQKFIPRYYENPGCKEIAFTYV